MVPAWWRDKRAVYDEILAGSKRMSRKRLVQAAPSVLLI